MKSTRNDGPDCRSWPCQACLTAGRRGPTQREAWHAAQDRRPLNRIRSFLHPVSRRAVVLFTNTLAYAGIGTLLAAISLDAARILEGPRLWVLAVAGFVLTTTPAFRDLAWKLGTKWGWDR